MNLSSLSAPLFSEKPILLIALPTERRHGDSGVAVNTNDVFFDTETQKCGLVARLKTLEGFCC